jgi:nucleotide-binding universal stress UspA family protein
MKILLATDGSATSQEAVLALCRLIDLQAKAEVQVVSVAERPAPLTVAPFGVLVEHYNELEKIADARALENSELAAAALREKRTDLTVRTSVLFGSPAQAIVEMAQEWAADLIVVGSHGYGLWQRVLLGSVSQAVVSHAPCSVLVVRQPKEP